MDRGRGYWWAPDGSAIAATRVDTSAVARWWISDPARPDQAPQEHAYPASGTDNAEVTLWVLALDGTRREVEWDRAAFPYLADVQWPEPERIVLTVQSRDQRHLQVLAAAVGEDEAIRTTVLFEDSDETWVELVHGAPAVLDDGRVVMAADHEGARRLVAASVPLTPPELQVRSIVGVVGHSLLFTANPVADATSVGLWRFSDGATTAPLVVEPGVHTGWGGGKTVVVRSSTLDGERSVTRVLGGPEIANHAETALVRPRVSLLRTGRREIATAVLLPEQGRDGEAGSLPVLLDPYGGPHAQRVLAARSAYYTSQWFADQGFAVVVADGRGTPGRGSELGAGRPPGPGRAGPRGPDRRPPVRRRASTPSSTSPGWRSAGGASAATWPALAVLRRPDVFHAAIAGAPVTDWRLYDTHYTERYLGTPRPSPRSTTARRSSPRSPSRCGRAPDPAAAPDPRPGRRQRRGRPHAAAVVGAPGRGPAPPVLPLSGVTHMTPQEVVAENLLLLQLDFLRQALHLDT